MTMEERKQNLSPRLLEEVRRYVEMRYVPGPEYEEASCKMAWGSAPAGASQSFEHSMPSASNASAVPKKRKTTGLSSLLSLQKKEAKAPAEAASRPREENALPAMDSAQAEEALLSMDYNLIEEAPALKKQSLPDRMEHLEDTFQERLLHLIDQKGMTDTDVYKRANLDRRLFSKIRCNPDYIPRKSTALALAAALKLSLAETKDLLARAGYALSPSSRFDLVVEYCFEKEIYNLFTINALLDEYGQPVLGG